MLQKQKNTGKELQIMGNEKYDLVVYTDGGARGNPGDAAYGFVVYDADSKIVYKEGKKIGITTNNVAEYKGVIAALNWIKKNMNGNNLNVKFYLDSMLVVSQLNGKFKVKDENMRSLFFTAKQHESSIKATISYETVRREKNKEADRLVNMALDGKI